MPPCCPRRCRRRRRRLRNHADGAIARRGDQPELSSRTVPPVLPAPPWPPVATETEIAGTSFQGEMSTARATADPPVTAAADALQQDAGGVRAVGRDLAGCDGMPAGPPPPRPPTATAASGSTAEKVNAAPPLPPPPPMLCAWSPAAWCRSR